MSGGGSPTAGGSGNGAPPSVHSVRTTSLWRRCRREIEQDYPFLVAEGVFDGVEALMMVCDVEEDARHLSGDTWLMRTPEDYFPVLTTYTHGQVVLQAVHADDR